MSSVNDYYRKPMFTDMLENICDYNQSCPSINRRDTRCKICDFIKQSQAERKVVLLSTRNMGKCLHKVCKAVSNEISQALPIMGESGSEVSYFIL